MEAPNAGAGGLPDVAAKLKELGSLVSGPGTAYGDKVIALYGGRVGAKWPSGEHTF